MTVFQEVVEKVRTIYPKFSPACLSLAMRSYETGVMLTPKAKAKANSVDGAEKLHKARSENRSKSISFKCRLTETAADGVKREMERQGIVTVQSLLEMLLLRWIEESRRALPTHGDSTGDCEMRNYTTTKTDGGQGYE